MDNNYKYYLQLVNKQYPWQINNGSKKLVRAPYTDKEIYLDAVVVEHLIQLIEVIHLQENVEIVDGHRTIDEQKELWQFSLKNRGKRYTHDYVAYPGCSEHHTGLALDIGLKKSAHDTIAPKFNGEEAEKFLAHMKDYGFILRYPLNKKKVTGIAYEPWHFRYVGIPHSQIITQQGWTLEEYIGFIHTVGEKVS